MILSIHAVLCVVLSLYLHASIHLKFGRPHLLFPDTLHSAFFPLCAPLSSSSHGRTTRVFFLHILDACATLVVPIMTFVFISDNTPPCHSAHPFQHPHLIYPSLCFLSSRCYPGLYTIGHSWSDHSFLNLSLQFQ